MADQKKKSKSKMFEKSESTAVERAGHVVLGIGGGNAGNAITTWLEKQPALAPYAAHVSAIPAFLAGLGYVLIPPTTTANRLAGAFLFGMANTSGTEEVEGLMGALQGALGMTDKQLGLGKTFRLGMDPSKKGTNDKPTYVNGVVVN